MSAELYKALSDALNALVAAGTITQEHAERLFAQSTDDPANPNSQAHPSPGEHIHGDPDAHLFGNLRTIKDVYQSGRQAVPWLVENLIPKGAITLLAAAPMAGKSTMLLSIMNSMTEGEEWAGLKVEQGSGWLFTDEGDFSLSEIVHDVGPAQESPHRIFPISRKGASGLSDVCYLAARGVDRLKELEEQDNNGWVPPKAIIFDTLGTWSALTDSNSYTEVIRAFHPLKALRDSTGCAVVLVHHARKNQESGGNGALPLVLGSVGFAAQADHVISLSKWGKGNSRKLQMSGRYRGALSELVVTYAPSEEPHKGSFTAGSEAAGRSKPEEQYELQVLSLFTVGVEYAMTELVGSKPIGLSEKALRATVKSLVTKGLLSTNGEHSNSPKLRYSLGTLEMPRVPLLELPC